MNSPGGMHRQDERIVFKSQTMSKQRRRVLRAEMINGYACSADPGGPRSRRGQSGEYLRLPLPRQGLKPTLLRIRAPVYSFGAMSTFDVPGWSIPTAPVREGTNKVSKKRKRPSTSTQLESAAVNVDRLMAKLASVVPEDMTRAKQSYNDATPSAKKRKEKQKQQPAEQAKNAASPVNRPPQKRARQSPRESQSKSQDTAKANKMAKSKHAAGDSPAAASSSKSVSAQASSSSSGLTALQKSMKDKLDGAQFRLINENLYKTDSHEAHNMMKENPKVFEEYHTGFRHQVLSWPTNPVEHYVSTFEQYPSRTIIADLGCGDAAIAKGLNDKGVAVLSYDLVSDNKYVIEADICDKIPLPGSEGAGQGKSTGEGQVVDVVVCSLSLMGVNWLNCIREAWRILKSGGELHIAEVTSRFTDIEQFQNLLGSIGFKLKSKDDTKSSHFILFEFTKVARFDKTEKEWTKLLSKDSKVNLVAHPIIKAELSKLRQASTSPKEFREGIDTISLLLGYEATRSLEESSFEGKTPVTTFTGTKIKPRIGLTPILRAGLGMTDALLKLFPSAPVYHLGLYREKVTLQPVEYYSKLPPSPPVDKVFLLDPLIATGGTAVAAMGMITEWGIDVKNIKLLCVLGSAAGLKHVQAEYPDLEIWVAGVDEDLTAEGIISPGLGDTGDRLFNTLR
ncbi:hypothetical protein D9619_000752 [Psilocybe cf. subviscida]|uniref:Ribosomal RNA-processing protein 8 n=1 Tax=Psilocybe cf. subviscida TaxID=2480587 RepID=A0A8H5BEV5_9AGAR|nr:hypothetical protein D9619_000752 [Psilocybe cf. subviscida]